MKIKNSWLILRHFGYDKKLDLVDELFQDALVIQSFSTVELKEKTVIFLKKIFNQFSEGAGYLTQKSLEKIFEPLEGNLLSLVCPDQEIKKYSNLMVEGKLSMRDWELFWR